MTSTIQVRGNESRYFLRGGGGFFFGDNGSDVVV
jgi:hypothetical protein